MKFNGERKMTKKDRIAVALTVPLIILSVFSLFAAMITSNHTDLAMVLIFLVPAVVYWGYRFIKGDISFMK
jgi:cation transport ATPase